MLNTLISPGCLFISAHLRHIAPNHTHCPTSIILRFIPQDSIFQKEAKRYITILMNSYSSCNPQLNSTGKSMMRKWRNSKKTSNQLSHQPSHQLWMILTFLNTHQTRRVHQRLSNLTLWYWIARYIHHWMVYILQKIGGMWTLKHKIR